jgi:hypothetical protein
MHSGSLLSEKPTFTCRIMQYSHLMCLLYCSDEELLVLPRNSSARHGRRAVSSFGTRSAGNSPRKSSQQLSSFRVEDWKDIIVPSNIMNQQKSFHELAASGQQFSIRNSSSASTNSREGREPSLEESWSSLSFFDKRHKGRLTEKVQGKCQPRLCM